VGSRAHPETKARRETLVIKVLLELLAHPQAHQADQDLAGHRGVESQEAPPWNMALLSDRLMNLTNVLLLLLLLR